MTRPQPHTRALTRSLLSIALGGCLAVAAPALLAQSTAATIRGQVMVDSAPATDARVTAVNTATGLSRSVQVTGNGNYNLAGLPPGTYRLQVEANGQSTSQTVTVAVGQTATLNLGVGGVAESAPAGEATDLDTVRVTAAALVETKTSEVATYVTQRQINALPQNSRNFLAFADTVPGMAFVTSANGQESQLRSGAQSANNINVFIDGVGQKNYVTPGGITGQDDSEGNPFPQSAIGEYKVISSNYKAEFDQISSAAISAVTRSGTNDFSGSFFWDHTDDSWRKATPREELRGAKDVEKVEQYGVSFGGPILRDRLHFFFSYEAKDIVRPSPVLPPNDAASRVDSFPLEILSQYGNASRPFNQDVYFGKLSWQASDEHLVEFIARKREEVGVLGIGGVNVPSAGTALNNDDTRYDLRSLYSTENWLNDAHITYEKASYNPAPINPVPSNRYTIVSPVNPNTRELEILNTGGGPNYQDKGQSGLGLQNDFTFFGWEGHTVKVGFKYKDIDLTAFQQFPPYPRYWYDIDESLTQPYRVEYTRARLGRDPFVSSNNKQFGIYVQDDWEVNDRLTVNLGVRWDYEQIASYTDYRLDPAIASALRGWSNIQNTDYDIENYISDGSNRRDFKSAIQPRVGFSYDLSGDQRHVIFGGAGRAYDRNLFDYMAREYYGGAFTTYRINFSTPLHQCAPSASCVPFDPSLLTQDGLDAYAAANPVAGGEVNLLNNDLKTPYSDQFSIGMRNTLTFGETDWNTSVTLSHIRGKDGIYFRLGNRRPDGSFHEFETLGQEFGNAPFSFAIPGYGNLILGDNGLETKLNALLLSVDKPYSDASPWGVNLAYTFSDATENRPNASTGETYLFDYREVTDEFYRSTGVPRHRLVLSGIWSPGWDVTLSSKLILESPTALSATNCLASPLPPGPNIDCRYEPYLPQGTVGFKQLDLAAEKRWNTGTDLSFRIRADLINAFNWRNWTNFDGRYGLGPDGRGPANPQLGARNGIDVRVPTRTFKLSFGIDW